MFAFGICIANFFNSKIRLNFANRFENSIAKSDSAKKDTFNLLLNKYNLFLEKIDSCERVILNANEKITSYKTSIENDNKISKKCYKDWLEERKKWDNDTTLKNNYFLLEKAANLYKKWDSVKSDSNNKIILIKKEEKSNKTSAEIKEKNQKLLIEINNEIKKYAGKINGGKKITFKGKQYYVFVTDLNNFDVQMHLKKPDGKNYFDFKSILESSDYKENKPLMITNAGMYTPTFKPQGLYVENFKKINSLDTTSQKKENKDNFYLKPNGVFYIDSFGKANIVKTDKYFEIQKDGKIKVKFATQSGPMLLINNSIHQSFVSNSINLKIRNGVGVINEKKIVFAISIDDVCFYEFAMLFKNIFGCENALFLDGAISKMYLNDLNPDEVGGKFGPMIIVTNKK